MTRTLEELRLECSLSPTLVAEIAGVGLATYWRMEQGLTKRIRYQTLDKIYAAFVQRMPELKKDEFIRIVTAQKRAYQNRRGWRAA